MIAPFLLLTVLAVPALLAWVAAWAIGDRFSRY